MATEAEDLRCTEPSPNRGAVQAFDLDSLKKPNDRNMLQAETADKICDAVAEAKATSKLPGSPKSLAMLQGGDHTATATSVS